MERRDFLQLAALAALPALQPRQPRAPMRVNGARLNSWLTRFDAIGRTATGINRVAYTDADLAGRAFTIELFREAGLTPRIDAAGNIIGRLEGREPNLPPILIGSHVDSVTDGGNFDGPVGSFGAIEVARTLIEGGTRLRHPLEVVVWQNEEGGLVGSKLAAGLTRPEELDNVARSGKTLREGVAICGGDVARLAEARRERGSLHCYVELHIEQGGYLERDAKQIGVVTGIVGLRWMEVTITGFANHAGATPMDQRQDAMLAAAKFTVAVNDAIRSEPGRQVATVGRVVVNPNTRNVIPGEVVLSIDLRDLDNAKIERFVARFEQLGREIGSATSTTFAVKTLSTSLPAMADTQVMNWIGGAADALGLSREPLPSGAGHDAQAMATLTPMGMIFIPSVGGISHSPREFSRADDITRGADVLLNTVLSADR